LAIAPPAALEEGDTKAEVDEATDVVAEREAAPVEAATVAAAEDAEPVETVADAFAAPLVTGADVADDAVTPVDVPPQAVSRAAPAIPASDATLCRKAFLRVSKYPMKHNSRFAALGTVILVPSQRTSNRGASPLLRRNDLPDLTAPNRP